MKKTVMALSTLVIVFIFCAIALEGAYRVYLYSRVDRDIQARAKKIEEANRLADNGTFSVYGAPGPWKYNEDYGFDFVEGPWLEAHFENGKFKSCSVPNGGNRFGNAGMRDTDYENAEFKVHIYGSSFTMGKLENGDNFADGLEDALSEALNKKVSVLNFSRDSVGITANFDVAAVKVPELKPDLALFLFNVLGVSYDRHWRDLSELDNDTSRLTYLFEPMKDGQPEGKVNYAERLVSKSIDLAWCDRQKGNSTQPDADLIKKFADVQHNMIWEEKNRPLAVNFASVTRSFVFNRVVKGDAFYDLPVYANDDGVSTTSVTDFEHDERFMDRLGLVQRSGIPLSFLYIPVLLEMSGELEMGRDFEKQGVRYGLQRFDSLQRLAGSKVVDVFDWYPDTAKSDPLSLVVSERDSHPNAKGNRVLIDAIVDALEDTPSTRHLFE